MSRTYRRKKGDQWWSYDTYTYEVIDNQIVRVTLTDEQKEIERKKADSLYRYRDRYCGEKFNKDLKWHSNMFRRTCKREQLYKILNAKDFDSMDYDNTKELLVKGLIWSYD